MKVLITGHRKHKLENYDTAWIERKLWEHVTQLKDDFGYLRGYAGMASGVDLWFCRIFVGAKLPYVACIPFDGQEETMSPEDRDLRNLCINSAFEVRNVKNSWMVEQADIGIVVWDGNKGGTHNVFQQLIENKKGFIWLNPVKQESYKHL